MNTLKFSALVLGGLLMAAPAMANRDLATNRGCMACHSVDKKVVGPAFQEIARKYKPGDEAKLIAKVKAGGSGAWGPMPMPAQSPAVRDDQIQTLVRWILAGAK